MFQAIITFKHNNTYEIWNMINLNILKTPQCVRNEDEDGILETTIISII
jgi:hypothetical protein